MDITSTLAPKSEQLDAVDLLGGPRVFTIAIVSEGNAEQPVNVYLAEFDRPWRPGVSMRRVLAACWGPQASEWVGRQVELYCDERVRFGGEAVGGTRIKSLSHIDGPRTIPLLVSKGRSAMYRVDPLKTDAVAAPTLDERIEQAIAAYGRANVAVAQLEARVALPADEWSDETLDTLEALYRALTAGETTKAAEFDMNGDDQ